MKDSSELAYTIAASMAFKEACRKCRICTYGAYYGYLKYILQVIMRVILSLTSMQKVGKFLSMNPKVGKEEVIKAEVPLSEMFGYSLI